ncbi:MBL fold metallo-hydrolase [Salipaludibacillus agaradhaerens]|uniref:MBL fold metallo-hydrolase n=1 Tax=Salipaludibacillus agaradhaerens TaxID=76935 RepID=A0A9Q4AZL6_SALAG|nr:MBL fold metallo-hydrolase [Salipaludibacillus agaradhaerens]MCR6095676.1 MBL fold metallo-hydrolase [Salipaludibacillus agaradhaerens]MCR6114764.1 MBL fold metallo-hydrolase [Salipaludibacillus agaradhaerens]
MKVTVIGYWGAYPEANEATSSFLVEEGETKVLLDCGSGAVAQLQNKIELKELDAVILSHYHHDHMADLGVLTYSRIVDISLEKTDRPLQIFAHNYDKEAFDSLGNDTYTSVVAYNESTPLIIGPLKVSFQKTAHPVTCYAMKVESQLTNKVLVYTADTAFEESLIPFAEKANLLIAETSFYAGQDGRKFGHMTSEEVAKLATASQAQSVLLSHLPHFGFHHQLKSEVQRGYSREVNLASSGAIFYL